MSSVAINELPRRPRRKAFTPLTGTLAAVIVAAGGFYGGVQVQKSHGSSSTASATPRAAGGFTGGPPGGATGGASSDAAATGTVSYVKGDVLYVKDANGDTVKVKVTSNAKVNRTATANAGKVHPGDSVVVEGKTSSSGTVTATSVTASQN
jgi:hypothetical protein